MLGGLYTILATETRGERLWYRLIRDDENDMGLVSPSNLRSIADFVPCAFRIGDPVSFVPTCSDSDIKYLHVGRDLPLTGVVKVSAVLNDFYIFLDGTPGAMNSFPFRWVDFSKAA